MAVARLTIFVVLALCASVVVARADTRLQVAVLGLEVIGNADARSTAVAHELTEGMRARARIGNGPYAYAPSSERELIDEKIIHLCDSEAPACMAVIAKGVSADVLVYGKLDRQRGNYRLQLHLLDATKNKKLNRISVTVPGKSSHEDMRAAAKQAYDELAGEIAPSGGIIEVVANVAEGIVFVDDAEIEALSEGKATLRLPEGRYTIAIEAKGRLRKEIRIDVKANETVEQTFQLAVAGGGAATGRSGSSSTAAVLQYSSYITGGIAGVMLVWTMTDFVRWRLGAGDVGSVTRMDDPATLTIDESQRGTEITSRDCNGPSLGPRVTSDPGGTLANVCRLRDRQFTTAIVTGVVAALAVSTYIGYRVTRPKSGKSGATEDKMTLRPHLSPRSAAAVFELRW